MADPVTECVLNEKTKSGDYDLMEDESHTLEEIVAAFRSWSLYSIGLDMLATPLYYALCTFIYQLGCFVEFSSK